MSLVSGDTKPASALTNCTVSDMTVDSEELEFLRLLNDYRVTTLHIGPVTMSTNLNRAATWLAEDMASKRYFSHTDSSGRDAFTRMRNCDGTTSPAAAENIARGTGMTAAMAFAGWKASPGHNTNMSNPVYKQVGIARAYGQQPAPSTMSGWYWVNDFSAANDGTDGTGGSSGGGSQTACGIPSQLETKDTSPTGAGSVGLRWSNVSGATAYEVQRQNGSTWETVATLTGDVRRYSGPDLANDPQWRIRVSAGTCGPLPGPARTFDP